MGIYSRYIFPRLLDKMLSTPEMGEYRRRVLAPVSGETLEIGFGTGLNLPYYPGAVTKLIGIDSEDMLPGRVQNRIARSQIEVTRMRIDATGRLPFDDHSFDSVVSTLTLCTISDAAAALAQVRRVLKPDGRFIFFEHGRSEDTEVARRQDRYNPIQKIIGAGCNINRQIDRLIETAGFEIRSLERFIMPDSPRIMAEMYCGVAMK
ncbi:MAG: class I SAM-dependent methyltransferase [Acidobacteria bacterium]|nr:class I SAM-dependent methyltransferase [Acidobacteriota bacterium]